MLLRHRYLRIEGTYVMQLYISEIMVELGNTLVQTYGQTYPPTSKEAVRRPGRYGWR